ncbi:acyltransferase family protein [Microbacterium allomyrinae]|uniref:Acyltransferase family protein n=1 Tax=Microbacterium allomyrinae TaxID=2830666 RepID=A0A9X1S2C2_9MICO|nr:acyltransferase family protein [Microbacterium allomyrinae]MCC2031844.1 acyltransferase family protein [Microbacterium allomyrinae]
MTENERARIAWPDAARGMAIVLVVLHHGIIYSFAEGLADPFWVAATEFLRTMRMPLFFMAAGLFAGKWVSGPWRPLFRSKVLLLAWVFALWVAIRWVVLNLIPGEDSETGILQLPLHMLWPIGGWFLFALAIFFVLGRLTKDVPPVWQIVVAGVISAVWFSIDNGNVVGNNAWDGIPLYYFFFVLGCYGRTLLLRAVDGTRLWMSIAIVAAWALAYFELDSIGLTDAPGISFALRLMGLAAGVVIAKSLADVVVLRHLGQSTLPIYMSHSLWIALAVWVATLIIQPSTIAGWLTPLAIGAVGLGLGYLSGRIAPKIRLGWLFDTPRWLSGTFDRAWPQRTRAQGAA